MRNDPDFRKVKIQVLHTPVLPPSSSKVLPTKAALPSVELQAVVAGVHRFLGLFPSESCRRISVPWMRVQSRREISRSFCGNSGTRLCPLLSTSSRRYIHCNHASGGAPLPSSLFFPSTPPDCIGSGQQNLANLYISPHTPTLAALICARRHDPQHPASKGEHFIGVDQAKAKGEKELVSSAMKLVTTISSSFICVDDAAANVLRIFRLFPSARGTVPW